MAERQVDDVDLQRTLVRDREVDRIDDVACVSGTVLIEGAQRD
jgi:hypothetical protein